MSNDQQETQTKPTSLAGWKKAKRHTVTLPSAAVVEIEDIVQQADFFNKLCAITVVEPKVTEEDFASGALPFEDKEMLVEFATRQRDLDAVSHHLAGLETSKSFRAARGLIGGIEDLEDV
jgi:hypothetical protein